MAHNTTYTTCIILLLSTMSCMKLMSTLCSIELCSIDTGNCWTSPVLFLLQVGGRPRSFSGSLIRGTMVLSIQVCTNSHHRQTFLLFSPTSRATGLEQSGLCLATATDLMWRVLFHCLGARRYTNTPFSEVVFAFQGPVQVDGRGDELWRKRCWHFLKFDKVHYGERFNSVGYLLDLLQLCHCDQISDRNNFLERGIILSLGS